MNNTFKKIKDNHYMGNHYMADQFILSRNDTHLIGVKPSYRVHPDMMSCVEDDSKHIVIGKLDDEDICFKLTNLSNFHIGVYLIKDDTVIANYDLRPNEYYCMDNRNLLDKKHFKMTQQTDENNKVVTVKSAKAMENHKSNTYKLKFLPQQGHSEDFKDAKIKYHHIITHVDNNGWRRGYTTGHRTMMPLYSPTPYGHSPWRYTPHQVPIISNGNISMPNNTIIIDPDVTEQRALFTNIDLQVADLRLDHDDLVNTDRYTIGTSSVGSSLRNASYDSRPAPPSNITISPSPWFSTNEQSISTNNSDVSSHDMYRPLPRTVNELRSMNNPRSTYSEPVSSLTESCSDEDYSDDSVPTSIFSSTSESVQNLIDQSAHSREVLTGVSNETLQYSTVEFEFDGLELELVMCINDKIKFNKFDSLTEEQQQELIDDSIAQNYRSVKQYKSDNCVACLDGECDEMLAPCGHVCLCQECATRVHKCPLCRKFISARIDLTKIDLSKPGQLPLVTVI
jgi:hypothetical protein